MASGQQSFPFMPEITLRTCLCTLATLTLLLTQGDRLCAEEPASQQVIFIALPWQLAIHDGMSEQVAMRAATLCNTGISGLSGISSCQLFDKQGTLHMHITGGSFAGPLHPRLVLQPPLWLTINTKNYVSAISWHTPLLTPAVARAGKQLRQHQARRAQRMADRAFYFGIDADNDALK